MSLTRKAASGAAFTIATGITTRVVGLIGTLLITHHLNPAVMGEVAAAMVLAFTGNWLSAWGFNQYVIVRRDRGYDHVFHASVLSLVTGTVTLVGFVVIAEHFTDLLNAPNLDVFLPGMALAVWIKRVVAIPDKLLMVKTRFRTVAFANAVGELTYITMAVTLVITTDLGGHAIVLANIAQSLAIATIELRAEGFRSWLTPVKWSWTRTREVFAFGTPIWAETLLSEAGRFWDKLLYAKFFGPHPTGTYSLAYNLSDLPATYVGENVAAVLFPTLVQVPPERRNEVFAQSLGLLALIIFPVAIGIASVAETLVAVLLSDEWQDVGKYLMPLSLVAIFRPMNAVVASLMLSTERNRTLMAFELLKVTLLVVGMWLLSPYGPFVAAGVIGGSMAIQFLGLAWILRSHGLPMARLFGALRGPALAALCIAAAVLPCAEALRGTSVPELVRLIVEVILGVLAYMAGLALFARSQAAKLIELARAQIKRKGVAQ